MKPLLILVCLTSLGAMVPLAATQTGCAPVELRSDVEVSTTDFTLADLLVPGTCPELLLHAALVRVGGAPLDGTVRVLDGNEVQGLFQKLASRIPGSTGFGILNVPRRITVRRSGARASCADITEKVLESLNHDPAFNTTAARPAAAEKFSAPLMDCGASGRIAQNAPLEFTGKTWDSASASWKVSARCTHAADCVPFLVRVHGLDPHLGVAHSTSPEGRFGLKSVPAGDAAVPTLANRTLLVRPGETATLLWDQNGIRLTISVICLDRGGPGDPVRARIAQSGRVLHAIVLGAGMLRAAS